ncbi:MAG: penicillin-binding protein 2 [Puniceicoccales bacterium]|nr:penicillin-binding protein 2 [Puniceicoccales bacterium]
MNKNTGKDIEKIARFCVVIFIILSCFCALIYRVLDLSYFSRVCYLSSLEKARNINKKSPAKRGSILDCHGEILATSVEETVIGVDPYIADSAKDKNKIVVLADILSIPFETVLEKFSKKKIISKSKISKLRWVPICSVDEMELLHAVERLQIKGVYGICKHVRMYPLGSTCAHITGFINHDGEAICGVEKYMDFYLRGQDGFVVSERDGQKRELVQCRTHNIPTVDGLDVMLTIDSNVQQMVVDELKHISETLHPECASIIVSDAATGELLAIGNYPTYDPNNYGKYSFNDMRNRAISDTYEPGSTFKIVSSSLALEDGLVSDETMFDCTQRTVINRGVMVKLPMDPSPFDKLSYVDVIRRSSNRGVAFMALMLGEQRMYDGARIFGYGARTGYGFDSESPGILHPPNKWDAMTITRLPMGHCIAVTPIQTNYAMAVFASGGLLLAPQLFKSVNDGQEILLKFEPKIRRRVLSKATADHVKNILNNPNYGKLKYDIAYCGKTGTTQKIINGKYSHERHVSSFSGFFPASNPKIVITVVVNDAKVKSGTAWGRVAAWPSFKNLVEKIYRYLDL